MRHTDTDTDTDTEGVDLQTLERVLRRETGVLDPDDVPGLLQAIRAEATNAASRVVTQEQVSVLAPRDQVRLRRAFDSMPHAAGLTSRRPESVDEVLVFLTELSRRLRSHAVDDRKRDEELFASRELLQAVATILRREIPEDIVTRLPDPIGADRP